MFQKHVTALCLSVALTGLVPCIVEAGTRAVGGTESQADFDLVHVFTSSGTFTVSDASITNVQILLVGGGGAGGYNAGAGGGAGGVVYLTNVTLSAGAYTVTVGAGGLTNASSAAAGGSGGDSSFSGVLTNAFGGGGGAGWSKQSGASGGCGGGGSHSAVGGAGTQGGAGGKGGQNCAGGGGGAGAAGGAVPSADNAGGAGGDGVTNAITGTAVVYGGGGGGGSCNNASYTVGAGGAGGGGHGRSILGDVAAIAGTDGLGGGGGGGSNAGGPGGANGGSGIVIIRYAAFDTTIPAVALNGVSGVTVSSAAVTGTVGTIGADAASCDVSVIYGPTADNLCFTNSVATLSAAGGVSTTLTGLAEATTYFVAFLARNNLGNSSVSSCVPFTTPVETVLVTARFLKKLPIAVSGYTGTSALTNFPVLVRLSTNITGFAYTDFLGTDGSDLRFADAGGNKLAHEIESWNADGTSCVWVSLPVLAGPTSIFAYYGSENPGVGYPATNVWTDYVGVWHFATVSAAGVSPDSTGHGLSLTAFLPAVSTGRVDGAAGNCVLNRGSSETGAGFNSPSYAAFGIGGNFTVSGWFKHLGSVASYERIFGSKNAWDGPAGFEVEHPQGDNTHLECRGANNDTLTIAVPDESLGTWREYSFVYNGTALAVYTNGAATTVSRALTGAATDSSYGLTLGNNYADRNYGYKGMCDEVRVRGGSVPADWAKAEYDTIASDAFVVAGTAGANDPTAPVFVDAPVVAWNGSAWIFSATLASGSGAVYSVVGTVTNLFSDGIVEGPRTFTSDLTATLAANTAYSYRVWATNANGTVNFQKGTNTFLNGEVSIAAGTNADELVLTTPGTFIVSRPAGALATNYDLTVTYAASGSAVAGSNYVALTGSVVIPAGAASATIEVYPLRTKDGDHTVIVTLTGDAYKISSTSNTASITIKTLTAPDGYNTWIAPGTGVADPAVATNWSKGTVPVTTDNIFVDGRFSQASMAWSNTMVSTVASWTQSADYTGTVTIATTYAHYDTAFTNFVITGDCSILGGTWTHPRSLEVNREGDWMSPAEIQANEAYRLSLAVGGTFTVGAAGAINADGKGHHHLHPTNGTFMASHGGDPNRAGRSYGNVKFPEDIGSGACVTSGRNGSPAGGGAVFMTARTAVVVDGTISVNGSGGDIYGSAAGGSVLIIAPSVSGGGTIQAVPGVSGWSEAGSSGGGGRIALLTTTPVDLARLTVSAGASANGYNACGTVYLHDSTSTYGTLIVDNLLARSTSTKSVACSSTPVTPDGDWTFDKVYLGGAAHLELPLGATLHLPNGFASVTSTNTDAHSTAIYLTGGTLDCGAETDHVMNGSFMLTSFTNNVFPGNLVLRNGAAIGLVKMVQSVVSDADPATNLVVCSISVEGSLTAEPTSGGVSAYFAGQCQTDGHAGAGFAYGGVHGGTINTNQVGLAKTTYDSVFNPRLASLTASSRSWRMGGGVVMLGVGGTLTLNADAESDSDTSTDSSEPWAAGGGGTLNITCGALAGTAKIHASGRKQSGGGRVAVRLTNAGATFDAFGVTNITAAGYGAASAGTVYLQTADEGELAGTIRINGNGAFYKVGTVTNNYATPVPGVGAYVDDAASFVNAKLDVSNYGEAQFTTNLTVKTIAVDATSKLDLLGKAVKVNILTLGGKKVAAGVYHAADAAVSDYVLDSAGSDGTITVCKFGGFYIIVQ